MKVHIYVTADGLEKLAKGNSESPYSWHWAVRQDGEKAPENSLEVGAVEIELPTPEQCVGPALAELNKRIQSTLANTEQEVKELKERCTDLACLSYSPESAL
jgi:hypothetical protein